MCLAICMSFLEKCLLKDCMSSVQFSVGLFLLLLSCMGCLYILEIKPLSVASFASIFSHSHTMKIVFSFFKIVSSAVQKIIRLIRSHIISIVLGD